MKKYTSVLIAVLGLALAGCTTAHHVTKWEYRFVSGDQNRLNQLVAPLAADGWQVMSVTSASGDNAVVTLRRSQK
jgi:hypothetical protein